MSNEVGKLDDGHRVSGEEREKVRAARQEQREKHKEQLDKAREEQIQRNEEKMARDARLRPTPTPDELNAAHAGLNVDHKEPDGSPEQDIHVSPNDVVARAVHGQNDDPNRYRSASPDGRDANYRTREARPAAHAPAAPAQPAKVEEKKAEDKK